MSKVETHIRGIDEQTFIRIRELAGQYNFSSVNQFLLYQLDLIAQNGATDNFRNHVADDLVAIKQSIEKIAEKSLKLDVQNIAILKQLVELEQLVKRWVEFMEVVDSGLL